MINMLYAAISHSSLSPSQKIAARKLIHHTNDSIQVIFDVSHNSESLVVISFVFFAVALFVPLNDE